MLKPLKFYVLMFAWQPKKKKWYASKMATDQHCTQYTTETSKASISCNHDVGYVDTGVNQCSYCVALNPIKGGRRLRSLKTLPSTETTTLIK